MSIEEVGPGGNTPREARTLLVVLRRYWWFIVVVTAVALIGTYFLTERQERTYQSTATVLLRTSESEFLFPFSESAPSAFLRNDVAERLYANSPAFRAEARALAPANTRVSIQAASPRLHFASRGGSAAAVAEAATIWAQTYLVSRQADIERATNDELDFLNRAIEELEEALAELRVDIERFDELLDSTTDGDEYARLLAQRVSLENLLQPQLDPVEQELAALRSDRASLSQRTRFFGPEVGALLETPAPVPSRPVSPNVTRNLLLGGALGLMLGTALPFVRVTAAGKIESREEVKESTALVTLANIPRYRMQSDTAIEVLDRPSSIASAQYQALLTAIEFHSSDEPINELMVTSAVSGDGKTTVAVNLASLAAQYLNVLLIDGDMRRPNVYERVGIPNDIGLADVLRGANVADVRHTIHRDGTSFDVLAAGVPDSDPALLLRGTRWSEVVNGLFLYDLVIVDAPPVLAVTDALLLGSPVDAQILVTRTRGTRRDELSEASDLVSRNNTRTLGVVVNQESSGRGKYSYYGAY